MLIEVELFLLWTPGFEGVVADGRMVVDCGLDDDKLRAYPRQVPGMLLGVDPDGLVRSEWGEANGGRFASPLVSLLANEKMPQR